MTNGEVVTTSGMTKQIIFIHTIFRSTKIKHMFTKRR